MKKYIAVERFADLQDGKRIYNAGDTFPRAGLTVTEERLVELSGAQNAAQRPLIKEVSTKEAEAPISAKTEAEKAHVETEAKKPEVEKKPAPKKSNSNSAGRKASKKNAD